MFELLPAQFGDLLSRIEGHIDYLVEGIAMDLGFFGEFHCVVVYALVHNA